MSLRSTEVGSEHLKLFLAVEQRYWMQDGGYVFLALPQFEHEARMTVAGLLPYLKYLANLKRQPGHRIDGFFTAEAVDRMSGAYYDPATREVVTEDDDYLAEIEMCDADMHFDLTQMLSDVAHTPGSPPSSTPGPVPPASTRPAPPALAVGALLGGTDSVTTFQTKGNSTATGKSASSRKSKVSSAPGSDQASLSNQSIFTEADRQDLQALQAATKQTQSDIASIQSDLRSLISALALDKPSQARQPGEAVTQDAGLSEGQTGVSL